MSGETVRDEPRQRWRVAYARDASAAALAQRDESEAWQAAIDHSRLPVVREPGGRARMTFGPPLPTGMTAERELLDLVLRERVGRAETRTALEGSLPAGHRIVDLWDVWLGAPPLAGQVVAADWRLRVEPVAGLLEAVTALLRARELPRERARGERTRRYDLRPLVDRLDVGGSDAAPLLLLRTRFDPALGPGRPEEVVAALGEQLGRPLVVLDSVRERMLLADESWAGTWR